MDNTTDSLREKDCSITEESLRNMQKDFSSMPPCSERSIICLLFYISLKLVDNKVISNHNIQVPDQIEKEIEKEFQCLKERLKIEELESENIQYSMQIAITDIKNENWRRAMTTLKQLFEQLYPLDMQKLFRLFENVDDAAQFIKDKDIILFLGLTGSGISTTVHFLAGSKMIEQEVAGLRNIAPTEVKNSDLKKVTISPFAQSETMYITPVKVNFADIGAANQGSIILCDSPGFQNTNGPEFDIANQIGAVKAIRGCKSVKLVVLISYFSFSRRCCGLKNLAYSLAGLLPGIEHHIRSFSYIFTKFPHKERDSIHAFLSDTYDKLDDTEKWDRIFMIFLRDMLQKTRKGARVLYPINGNPREILDELTESVAIQYPEEVFQFSITERSKAIVQEQVRKYQLSIMSATKRSEYSFIKHKVDQLKHLNELLGRDYIEQIYNDCVQYISKHLFEEYQEGISALNRSIMNQIPLSNEDIEQYKTLINHAKLFEELQKSHLGNEIIHSSIYIQYVKQQIEIVLENLKEKDINDLSMKIDLDKIKLLSNSFPNINSKYKTACQCVTEKFDLVVKSFGSSVLSNTFDQCASDISKLYKAIPILKDHLNSENMEAKYTELKESFLNYLNNSTEKLNYVFRHEKLEANDVDSLNSCVHILETAKDTFLLHLHISKEAINQIYEDFLSKIINHFDEIVKKINTQFKNENLFHIVEQYMEELDLIRTISIIEVKTAQSYYSTLEKIIGYIYQSRRDIEEILNSLFQREKKVDYDKLIKHLSNLNNAKWIEKYRTGVHLDIINIEEQIIQYIEELKKSILKIDLDPFNYNKIEYVYNIVSEINQIKYIKKFFPNINQHIDEVNYWFGKEINNVLLIINDTFTIEKLKKQEYQMIGFHKIEDAFCCLDICKRIYLSFNNDRMSVVYSLEEFVRYFSNSRKKDMETCFEMIQEYENDNEKDIRENVRILSNYLEEIIEIKTKYPHVFSCFSNQKIIEYWQNELFNYLIILSAEIENRIYLQRIDSFNAKLLIVKALSKLDKFLEGEKFIDVYKKYQNTLFTNTADVCKRVIEAIMKNDYGQVASEMAALQWPHKFGEHIFQHARRAINIGLNTLLDETKNKAIMLGRSIEKEEVNSIVESLKRIQKAEQFVSQYVDTLDDIHRCIDHVKCLLTERIHRCINEVKSLISINKFYEAENKIESIMLVRNLLGVYCTEDAFERIAELTEYQECAMQEVAYKYSEIDISSYVLHPPTDIFEKFEEIKNINSRYYRAYITIKEAILTKFRQELVSAKSKLPPSCDNIHIRKFESAVKYLPKDMREALEVELKYCKEDIDQLKRDSDNQLNNACSYEARR